MTRRVADIVPGARIVTGSRGYVEFPPTADQDGLAIVTVAEDEEGLHFVNAAGAIRRFERPRDPWSSEKLRMPSEVLWTVPVPAATDDELRRLASVTTLQRRHGGEKPWMLHVQAVVDGIALALPVLPAADAERRGVLGVRDDDAPDAVVGNAAVWTRMVRVGTEDPSFRKGALVVMWPDKARIVDGLALHSVQAAMAVASGSVVEIGAWLPGTMGHSSYYSAPYHGVSEIDEEELRARLREQPDEALIFGYVDGDGRGGLSLGTSGITFHHVDDPVTDVYGMDDPELGLWLAADARWRGSGEDVEIESDLRPATLADLERFGHSAADFRTEVAGHFDVHPDEVPEDVAEQAIAQAAEIAARDSWIEKIRKPWTDAYAGIACGDHRVRQALWDVVSEAARRAMSADGLALEHRNGLPALVWPEASLTWQEDRLLTFHADGRAPVRQRVHDVRATESEPALALYSWLESRPEHVDRSTPHDPRTVVPVRPAD
jgi:hypothetical protein